MVVLFRTAQQICAQRKCLIVSVPLQLKVNSYHVCGIRWPYVYHRLRTHVPLGLIPRLHGMEPGHKAKYTSLDGCGAYVHKPCDTRLIYTIYKNTQAGMGTVCMYFHIVCCGTFIHAVTYKLPMSDVIVVCVSVRIPCSFCRPQISY